MHRYRAGGRVHRDTGSHYEVLDCVAAWRDTSS